MQINIVTCESAAHGYSAHSPYHVFIMDVCNMHWCVAVSFILNGTPNLAGQLALLCRTVLCMHGFWSIVVRWAFTLGCHIAMHMACW